METQNLFDAGAIVVPTVDLDPRPRDLALKGERRPPLTPTPPNMSHSSANTLPLLLGLFGLSRDQFTDRTRTATPLNCVFAYREQLLSAALSNQPSAST